MFNIMLNLPHGLNKIRNNRGTKRDNWPCTSWIIPALHSVHVTLSLSLLSSYTVALTSNHHSSYRAACLLVSKSGQQSRAERQQGIMASPGQKVVLITGCSSGIGLRMAVMLANDEQKRYHGRSAVDVCVWGRQCIIKNNDKRQRI